MNAANQITVSRRISTNKSAPLCNCFPPPGSAWFYLSCSQSTHTQWEHVGDQASNKSTITVLLGRESEICLNCASRVEHSHWSRLSCRWLPFRERIYLISDLEYSTLDQGKGKEKIWSFSGFHRIRWCRQLHYITLH